MSLTKIRIWNCRTIQKSWELARADAKLQHVRLHDLRHTAATRLKDKLVISDVGLILGHSDPRTTQRYVNRTPEVVRAAGEVLHDLQERNRQSLETEIQTEQALLIRAVGECWHAGSVRIAPLIQN